MRDRMGWQLWEEWLEYLSLEPIGSPIEDVRLAYLLASLSNTVGGGRYVSAKKREAYGVQDFLLHHGSEQRKPKPRRMTADETVAHVSAIFAAFGAHGRPPKN